MRENMTRLGDGSYAATRAWCPSCGSPDKNHLGPCHRCGAMGFTTTAPTAPLMSRTTRIWRLCRRWVALCRSPKECGRDA